MNVNWTDKFLNIAKLNGLDCLVSRREHGWPETLIINGYRCYCKSKTYDNIKRGYYIGVDPKKLKEEGDLVLICGVNSDGKFRDIFLIPWKNFFETLSLGDPKNTYKLPREYIQYRTYLRDRNKDWVMSVQPAGRHEIIITQWRYSIDEVIKNLKSMEADPVRAYLDKFAAATPEEQKEMLAELKKRVTEIRQKPLLSIIDG
ncbi:MAG: hypothetical protein ABSE95_02415 [Thermodesulfobacteriota bacterium]|jgi:hypothetical protein